MKEKIIQTKCAFCKSKVLMHIMVGTDETVTAIEAACSLCITNHRTHYHGKNNRVKCSKGIKANHWNVSLKPSCSRCIKSGPLIMEEYMTGIFIGEEEAL